MGLALIDVGDGERAAGAEAGGGQDTISLCGWSSDVCSSELVVGAVDGDGDDLAGGAVAGDGGEAVGDRLSGAELLDGGLAVVGAVGPAAVGGEREIGRASCREGVWLGVVAGLVMIELGDGERAAGAEAAV